MALGNYNNNKKYIEPSVYGRYAFANPNAKVDPSRLVTGFWSGYLKLTIQPKSGEQNEKPIWDKDNGITIYLTHFKADIFKKELTEFIKDPNAVNSRGVECGPKRIFITNGKDLGVDCPVIIIQDMDEGKVRSEYAYQINKEEYYYAMRNVSREDPSAYDKKNYSFLELDALIILLDEYVKAMTCAQAYSNIDNGRFNYSRVNTKIDLICDKLGIQRKNGGNSTQPRSLLYNDGGTNNTSNNNDNIYTNMDEIEEAIK